MPLLFYQPPHTAIIIVELAFKINRDILWSPENDTVSVGWINVETESEGEDYETK